MKRFCVVTILFILIVSSFVIPSFAYTTQSDNVLILPSVDSGYNIVSGNGNNSNSNQNLGGYVINGDTVFSFVYNNGNYGYVFHVSVGESSFLMIRSYQNSTSTYPIDNKFTSNNVDYYRSSSYAINKNTNTVFYGYWLGNFTDPNSAMPSAISVITDYYNNLPPQYSKNPNVDEFIANTLISMGVKFNSYTSALPVAQFAWDYLIDEDNWYIGSGDRNDKDIKWDIDNAVSYLNAQSNNYMDWYNGYKVSKDVTIALTKFIKDNYVASTLNNGTLAGENVYLNTQYLYASSGGSAPGGSFGSSPSAFSFYPASTVTYFNGQYLHDNNEIDLDEFIYTPADVRKFISYPSSAGLIEPPTDSTGTGVITDGNGDTVYNIDLDFPSLDWLADAIQAVLDFLNRLITTIADFLTQILDAILSLFSDAFESLTTFGQGIIEWLYSVIESLGTLGSNYIPSDLWAIILPFIYLNVGIAVLLFVLRSH